jgi:hypothetical protein
MVPDPSFSLCPLESLGLEVAAVNPLFGVLWHQAESGLSQTVFEGLA